MLWSNRALALLFSITLFISAGLLFWVQPLIAKMLLPLLGGMPAVWNTCMLFFQGMLLAGYSYALVTSARLRVRQQIIVHVCLLLLAALYLPIRIRETAVESLPAQGDPVFWLLACLLATAGLPFFIISTSGPLLQKWFSQTRHPSAGDPYFLFAASNLGSLGALVAFPLLLEPSFALPQQHRFWAAGYAALAALMFGCAVVLWRLNPPRRLTARQEAAGADDGESLTMASASPETLTPARRFRWMLLAFIPSSLMLGVTTYISTDIATTPLLWVIPLALYLLTFVLAFARKQLLARRLINRVMAGAAVILALVYLSGATEPAWFLLPLHLLFFFVAALVCHGQLADDRPSPRHLAEFYLWLSIGGALGGLFNAVIAPGIFNTVVEYPLAIVLACLMLPRERSDAAVSITSKFGVDSHDAGGEVDRPRDRWLDFVIPAALCLLTVGLALLVARFRFDYLEQLAIVLGVPLMISYLFRRRPVRLALGIGAIMLGHSFYTEARRQTLHVERNFFGVLRVTVDDAGIYRRLYHDTTLHGRQFTDPARQCEPLSYYHRSGPLGRVFESLRATGATNRAVAVVGLGAGATLCYALPDERWTFYEINPAVIRIARDARYFTYLSNCARGATINIIAGDARLRLQGAPASDYDLIVLDAFSSDAIPTHLITRQAMELYLSKLAEGGLLAFHISNRSLNLEPLIAGLIKDRNLAGLAFNDVEADAEQSKERSQWVVVARRATDFGDLKMDARWQPPQGGAETVVWTDEFSNILSVFKWR